MEKKITILISVLLLVSCLSFGAYAASCNTYDLDEIGIEISIPDELNVITRTMEPDDPALAVFGLSLDEVVEFLQSNCIYLEAMPDDDSCVINLYAERIDIKGVDDFSDSELEKMLAIDENTFDDENVEITVLDSGVYQHAQTRFLKTYWIENDSDAYMIYSTIYNYKYIFVGLISESGEISESEQKMLQDIVDSMSFHEVTGSDLSESQDADGETNSKGSFIYQDEESAVKFTVPGNWIEKPLDKEYKTLNAKFVPDTPDTSALIYYGAIDLWNEMDTALKDIVNRADIEFLYDKSKIAEMLKTDENEIETVMYNEKMYFKWIGECPLDDQDNEKVPRVVFIAIENGWMHEYQFLGDINSQLYLDFESLIKSADYSEGSDNSLSTDAASDISGINNVAVDGEGKKHISAADIISNTVFEIFLGFIIYLGPLLIYRYSIRKKPLSPSSGKKIIIIYAILFTVVLTFLLGEFAGMPSVFLAWISYKLLTKGYCPEDN